jgi:hypothetical protein
MKILKILAVDISGLFSQFWEVDNGRGRDFDKPRTSTVSAVRRFREGHDRVAICCDSGKSFRAEIWPSYKANRPDRGEAYRNQLRLTIEALAAEGCSVFRAPRYGGETAIGRRDETRLYRRQAADATGKGEGHRRRPRTPPDLRGSELSGDGLRGLCRLCGYCGHVSILSSSSRPMSTVYRAR